MGAAASLDDKVELLRLLEEKRRRNAVEDLNAYCGYIEIPGVPINDDSCPDGADCEDPECPFHCEEFYPDTVKPAQHHRLINDTLQKVEAGAIDPETGHKYGRVMMFMPPGSAKSTYGSVTFPTWYMGKNPGKNVITTSYGSDLAKRFGRKCRSITRSREYGDLFDAELVPDNRAVDDWALTNGSTFMSGGILAGITGNRADLLVVDDPVKGREDADSPTIRAKTWEAYLNDLRTRLKPGGSIVIIQTRWHEDDLSGRILPDDYDGQSGWVQAKDGEWWYVICLQAQAERDDDPLGRQRGDWLWTDWKPVEEWEQEKITQGERNWSALYQQRPKPLEGAVIKRAWVNRYIPGELPPDSFLVHSWDTANKPDEALNAPSVNTIWAVSKLGYYLVHVYRDWIDYPTLKRRVKELYEDYPASVVLIEDKASGQSLIQDLQNDPHSRVPVHAIEPEGDKFFRIESVSGQFAGGLVYLPMDRPDMAPAWLADCESELFGFPLTTFKDQVDSISQAIKYMHHNRPNHRFEMATSGRFAGHSMGD